MNNIKNSPQDIIIDSWDDYKEMLRFGKRYYLICR